MSRTKLDPAVLERIKRHLKSAGRAEDEVIRKLFGELPEWLPEPVLMLIRSAVQSLRAARQSDQRIVEVVNLAGSSELNEIPASALDSRDFSKSANYLAHVQWALSLGKEQAIRELAGSNAAKNYKRDKAGREAQAEARSQALPEGHLLKGLNIQQRNTMIRKKAAEMLAANPKRKPFASVAAWAKLSEKQIRRIVKEK